MIWGKWSATFKAFAFLLLAAAMVDTKVRVHALIWVMVISLGYFGVRGGVFVFLTGGAYRVWGPPNTMISDNNQIAAALLVCLPLMNYLRMQSAHRVVRMGVLAAMGLTLLAVLGSYSRGALVGVAAVGVFLWWNGSHKAVSGVVMVAVMAGALSFMPANWVDRMSTIQDYQSDASAEGRFAIWETSLTLAIARPLTGGGFLAPYNQEIVSRYTPGTRARAVHSIYFRSHRRAWPADLLRLGRYHARRDPLYRAYPAKRPQHPGTAVVSGPGEDDAGVDHRLPGRRRPAFAQLLGFLFHQPDCDRGGDQYVTQFLRQGSASGASAGHTWRTRRLVPASAAAFTRG